VWDGCLGLSAAAFALADGNVEWTAEAWLEAVMVVSFAITFLQPPNAMFFGFELTEFESIHLSCGSFVAPTQ
jgi:hypothetical protein